MRVLRDPIVAEVVESAREIWRDDRESYMALRDRWSETLFFRLGPEGCMAALEDLHSRCGSWTSQREDAYRKLATLFLARSVLYGLVLRLPPTRSSRAVV